MNKREGRLRVAWVQRFATEKLVICQVDVEVHSDQLKSPDFNFADYARDLWGLGPWLPIAAYDFVARHKKLTLVNVGEAACEAAFGFSRALRD